MGDDYQKLLEPPTKPKNPTSFKLMNAIGGHWHKSIPNKERCHQNSESFNNQNERNKRNIKMMVVVGATGNPTTRNLLAS